MKHKTRIARMTLILCLQIRLKNEKLKRSIFEIIPFVLISESDSYRIRVK